MIPPWLVPFDYTRHNHNRLHDQGPAASCKLIRRCTLLGVDCNLHFIWAAAGAHAHTRLCLSRPPSLPLGPLLARLSSPASPRPPLLARLSSPASRSPPSTYTRTRAHAHTRSLARPVLCHVKLGPAPDITTHPTQPTPAAASAVIFGHYRMQRSAARNPAFSRRGHCH